MESIPCITLRDDKPGLLRRASWNGKMVVESGYRGSVRRPGGPLESGAITI